MKAHKIIFCLGFALALFIGFGFSCISFATPHSAPRPVRIAIVAASGSGIEQQLVDALTEQLQEDPSIVLSTVNPDWYVTCRVEDHIDTSALSVRVNGTVSVETAKGDAVLSKFSAQANKQDFSVSGQTQINKALVTSAMNEVVANLTQRAVQPIEDAVFTEIDARDKIAQAKALAAEDKYDEALTTVMTITRNSPHFWPAHTLVDQLEMEKAAFNLVTEAKALAKQGKYQQAIADLRQVDRKSKRHQTAVSLIASYSRPTLAKNKSTPASVSQAQSSAQLKALAAEKRSLEARRRAIEAQEAAIRSTH